jgi:hypothetical protein
MFQQFVHFPALVAYVYYRTNIKTCYGVYKEQCSQVHFQTIQRIETLHFTCFYISKFVLL